MAHRNARGPITQRSIETLLSSLNLLNPRVIDSNLPTEFRHPDVPPSRVLKLKERTAQEKGVIIVKFNQTYSQLRKLYDMDRILADYHLVLEMSYYGCCCADVLQYLRYAPIKVFIGTANPLERGFIERLDSNLVPVDFSSSTWVHDQSFKPLNLEKTYDCIMIASWSDVKRHFLLFEAIRKLNDPTFKACLIGTRFDMTMDDIKELTRYYGIEANVDVFQRIPPEEVNELFNKSKVNLLLTYKEGGNKAIVEGMFAGTPALVVSDHIGVNLGWINEQTGRLADPGSLHKALRWFREHYTEFSPREWALGNISCHESTRKLEEEIRRVVETEGGMWVESLAVKTNRPELEYYDDTQRRSPFDIASYRRP